MGTKLNLLIDVAEQFIDGTYDYDDGYKHKPYDVLLGLFIFDESPQGSAYWWNRLNDLEKGKGLSNTAKRHILRMIDSEKRRVKS